MSSPFVDVSFLAGASLARTLEVAPSPSRPFLRREAATLDGAKYRARSWTSLYSPDEEGGR